MDISGDVFSMSLALTLQRVAPPSSIEAAELRLSDTPMVHISSSSSSSSDTVDYDITNVNKVNIPYFLLIESDKNKNKKNIFMDFIANKRVNDNELSVCDNGNFILLCHPRIFLFP